MTEPEKVETPCPYPYVAVGPLACRGCDTLAEALGVAAETGATVYGRLGLSTARRPDAAGGLPAACDGAAAWLEARAAHYRGLGSEEVAAGLAAQAETLRAALAEAEGG